jgi:hypothetical protein
MAGKDYIELEVEELWELYKDMIIAVCKYNNVKGSNFNDPWCSLDILWFDKTKTKTKISEIELNKLKSESENKINNLYKFIKFKLLCYL